MLNGETVQADLISAALKHSSGTTGHKGHEMKTQFLLSLAALMISSSHASASSMLIDCSSADSSTTIADGHRPNVITLTIQKWNGSNLVRQPVKFDRDQVMQKVLATQEIAKESKQSECREGYGWASHTTVTYQRIEFRRADGGLFAKGTIGASQDLKSVTADLLCREMVDSEMYCPDQKK